MQNNRRVNDQKRVAIEEGRKKIGVKGKGKGLALESVPFSEEDSDLEEPQMKNPVSDGSRYSPSKTSRRPRRQATKRTYKEANDDGIDEVITSKRTRKRIPKPASTPLPNLNTDLPSGITSTETSYPSSATDHGYALTPPTPLTHAQSLFTTGMEAARPVNSMEVSNSMVPYGSTMFAPREPMIVGNYGFPDPNYRGHSMYNNFSELSYPCPQPYAGGWTFDGHHQPSTPRSRFDDDNECPISHT